MLQNLAISYSYGPSITSSNNSHLSGAFLGFILIVALVVIVFYITALWKIFIKAGRPGWAAIIPFYNSWILFEISGKPGWWMLFGLIPILGSFIEIVLIIIAMLELAKRFGKSPVFGVVLLVLFSFIGYPILAFGKSQYSSDSPSVGFDDTPSTPAPLSSTSLTPAEQTPTQQPPVVQ